MTPSRGGYVVPDATLRAMPMFCRHNRLTANCPICSRELQADLKSKAPVRSSRPRTSTRGGTAPRAPRCGDQAAREGGRRRLSQPARARPARDRGRRAAGLRAGRRRRPARAAGPVSGGGRRARPRGGDVAGLPARAQPAPSEERGRPVGVGRGCRARTAEPRTAPGRTAPARRRRRSAARPSWTPQRRFSRVFERLALPGFAPRRALRPADRARRRRPLRARGRRTAPDGGEDATTEAAKRLLVSGDKLLLERRARDLAEAAERAARGARPRARAVGHAGRPRRPGRRGARADPGGALPPVSAQAVPAPPRAAAARADDRAGAPPRRLPMAVLLLACLALAALSLLLPSTPTYDPWAWIIWGREITQWDLVTTQRAVVEAAPGAVHDAVRAGRGRRRAGAVAGDRARGRAARVRDGVPPGRAAGGPVGGRDRRRRRCSCPTSSSSTSRAATPRACSWRSCCGRSSAISTATGRTPSCSASRPRCCGPRCGRSGASTASGSCTRRGTGVRRGARSRWCSAPARSRSCCGSCRSTSARATGCAPPRARGTPTPTRRRSPPRRSRRSSAARRRSCRCRSTSAP